MKTEEEGRKDVTERMEKGEEEEKKRPGDTERKRKDADERKQKDADERKRKDTDERKRGGSVFVIKANSSTREHFSFLLFLSVLTLFLVA